MVNTYRVSTHVSIKAYNHRNINFCLFKSKQYFAGYMLHNYHYNDRTSQFFIPYQLQLFSQLKHWCGNHDAKVSGNPSYQDYMITCDMICFLITIYNNQTYSHKTSYPVESRRVARITSRGGSKSVKIIISRKMYNLGKNDR